MKREADEPDNQQQVGDRLQENDIFITEYLNTSSQFSGIIKHRYTDFQVNEIDCSGNVIHLTTLDAPTSTEEEEVTEELFNLPDDVDINVEPQKILSYPLDTDNQWIQLALLLRRDKKEETIRIEVTNADKETRTVIHKDIEKKFGGKLNTKTIDDDGRKYIEVGTSKRMDKRNNSQRQKNSQYLHFALYKENIDTINAVRILSKSLRIPQNRITYAGTKDRRAVTTQKMCVRGADPKRISSLSRDRLWFGNFEYSEKAINLGDLKGNRFSLALRQVEASDEIVDKTMEHLKLKGFINYYGLQRFGSNVAAPTHKIGKCLICEQWKEVSCLIRTNGGNEGKYMMLDVTQAVSLILHPRKNEKQSDIEEACKIWTETKDASRAIKGLKRDVSAEGIILRTLAQQGNSAYVNALQKVPRNIILLYVHSFQSLVWNAIVSRRIKEFGLRVLPGDIISASSDCSYLDDDLLPESNDIETVSKPVKFVSTQDVDSVSICDIVYPLPGYAIQYPKNVIAEWYKEILIEHGVSTFDTKNKMFTASGDYRKMIVIPENVEWKTACYEDVNADLIATDLQRLKNEKTVETQSNGPYKAVIMQFDLPSCTYATMALRELTKMDTSSSYQATLTNNHSERKKAKLSVEDSRV